ncbi:MAG: tetratricopeptide repeat protein [Pyrinomonadaceae bacterium]
MNGKVFWLSIVAVIISFVGGFLLANALNRSDLNTLRAENDRLKNSQTESKQNDSESVLSDEEIQEKIAEADRNPTDYAFQKNLGFALYRYASMKQNTKLLAEVGRILSRVYENNSQDYAVVVTLGNVYFDIGYAKKDNAQFEKAREFYQSALAQKPSDVGVRTDYGLTYFLTQPPDAERAIAEFQKSLQTNPKHEKTLQVLTQTLLSENKANEAEKYLAQLKEVNRDNQSVPEFETQIAQIKNNSPKQ